LLKKEIKPGELVSFPGGTVAFGIKNDNIICFFFQEDIDNINRIVCPLMRTKVRRVVQFLSQKQKREGTISIPSSP